MGAGREYKGMVVVLGLEARSRGNLPDTAFIKGSFYR
jgi:hypothetical protein